MGRVCGGNPHRDQLLGCTPARQDPETLLAPETAGEIFQAYEEEIRGIEAACGTEIRDYTEQTREILARAAMDSYGTDSFARLSQLVTDLTAAAWNQDGEGESGDSPAYTAAKPFGPLKGVSFWEVPPGVSLSGNLSGLVEVSPGELVGDLEISEAVSVEIPLERADGPADGTHLSNGKKATHRVFTGVLWGVILAGPGESNTGSPARWVRDPSIWRRSPAPPVWSGPAAGTWRSAKASWNSSGRCPPIPIGSFDYGR